MKTWVIIAIVLIVLGIVLFLIGLYASGFDLKNLSNINTVTNSHSITEDFNQISISTEVSDTVFVRTDGDCRVVCREFENTPHRVTVEDGCLTVRLQNNRKWYDYIGFGWSRTSITVYLPKAEYDRLEITTDTGDITADHSFSFKNATVSTHTGAIGLSCNIPETLTVSATTGDITLSDMKPQNLYSSCSTGRVTLSHVTATENIHITTTTGNIQLSRCQAGGMQLKCSTGKLTATNTICNGPLQAETSTGDISLTACDANTLKLTTHTGKVTGTLLTDKIIFAKSNIGKISVPNCVSGGRCEISTDTGDIRIQIQK